MKSISKGSLTHKYSSQETLFEIVNDSNTTPCFDHLMYLEKATNSHLKKANHMHLGGMRIFCYFLFVHEKCY